MKKAGLIAAAVLIVALLLGGWLALFADYSEGYRVGKIIKLSHKGYLFKTWEGTLDFGYLQNDPAAGVATRIWEFSVSGGSGRGAQGDRRRDRRRLQGQGLVSRKVYPAALARRHQALRLQGRARGLTAPDALDGARMHAATSAGNLASMLARTARCWPSAVGPRARRSRAPRLRDVRAARGVARGRAPVDGHAGRRARRDRVAQHAGIHRDAVRLLVGGAHRRAVNAKLHPNELAYILANSGAGPASSSTPAWHATLERQAGQRDGSAARDRVRRRRVRAHDGGDPRRRAVAVRAPTTPRGCSTRAARPGAPRA